MSTAALLLKPSLVVAKAKSHYHPIKVEIELLLVELKLVNGLATKKLIEV